MVVNKYEQIELPEYISCPFAVLGFKTADGTGQKQLFAAGHHPKMRVVKASVIIIAGTVAATAVVEDGDGVDAVTALDTGTTLGATTVGTLVAGQYFDRNEAVMINIVAAGTGVYALYFVQCESID